MILSTEKVIHPVSHIEYPAPLSGAAAPLFTPERADGRIDFEGHLIAFSETRAKGAEFHRRLIRQENG